MKTTCTLLAVAFLVSLPCSAGEIVWERDKEKIAATEVVLTAMLYDSYKLQDMGTDLTTLEFDIAVGTSGFAYNVRPGASYAGQPLSLGGTGQLTGNHWAGQTSGMWGSTPIETGWTNDITFGSNGATGYWSLIRHTRWEPDETWDVEVSPGGGSAISTHEGGGEDRGVLEAQENGPPLWRWELTKKSAAVPVQTTISLALADTMQLGGTGSISFALLPEPASLVLIGIGFLVTLSRRVRFARSR